MLHKKNQGEFLADFMLETNLGKKASYYEESSDLFIYHFKKLIKALHDIAGHTM